MKEEDVNRLITKEVDKIEETEVKQFIRDILAYERSKMDQDQPRFKDTYKNKIQEYGLEDDE